MTNKAPWLQAGSWWRTLVCGGVAALVMGCDERAVTAKPDAGNLIAAVSLLPQAYFVERVGGEHVRVEVLVGPGQSHATYEPTARQLAELAYAQLFFKIGLSFEDRVLDKLRDTHPNLRIVDTRRGITLRRMADHGDTHDGACELGAEAPGGLDPHIWLDPLLVKMQARTICDALREVQPTYAGDFEQNLAAFTADLDALHAKIAKLLAPYRGRSFFIFHPALGYFADAYGLRQVAVEIGGREPSAKQLAALITQARAENIRVIFVQQQFARKSAEAIAQAIEGRVLTLDPLARDYMTNLYAIAQDMAVALRSTDTHPKVSRMNKSHDFRIKRQHPCGPTGSGPCSLIVRDS